MLIKEKVSEERIGAEMDKMLEGLKAAQAIEDLHRLDLLKLIYRLPSSQTEYLQSEEKSIELCCWIAHFLDVIRETGNFCGVPVSFSKEFQ